jgi:hypothetical protein
MCHDHLSQADINAIGKARGFTAAELSSRAMLENYYLSTVGVAQAVGQLSADEVTVLHLLHLYQKPAPITLFERLFPGGSSTYLTFSQRYQPVFKQVRERLVRRGLLIKGQYVLGGDTKMEQWRFVFPAEFLPFLPSPLAEVQRLETVGEVQRDVPRAKLMALLGQTNPPGPALPDYVLTLQNGRFLIQQRPFQAADLTAWQKAAWQALLPAPPQKGITRTDAPDLPPLEALTFLLQFLRPGEWVAPDQLDAPLKLLIGHQPDTDGLCHLGWKWGYLARNEANGRFYYRLADLDPTPETAPSPHTYLTVINDHTVSVNLQTVPYLALEQLNQIAYFTLTDQLYAAPDLARTGAAISLRTTPLVQWLIQHVPAFANTWQLAQKRWGKQIIHHNLFIACVTDLALRVQLERGLKSSEFLILSDEYVAFPSKAINKVKRIVEQAGHVIKYHET